MIYSTTSAISTVLSHSVIQFHLLITMILGATPLELLGVNTAGSGPSQLDPNTSTTSSPKPKTESTPPEVKTEPGTKKPAEEVTSPKVKSSPK